MLFFQVSRGAFSWYLLDITNQVIKLCVNHLPHENDFYKGLHNVTWYPGWDPGTEEGH